MDVARVRGTSRRWRRWAADEYLWSECDLKQVCGSCLKIFDQADWQECSELPVHDMPPMAKREIILSTLCFRLAPCPRGLQRHIYKSVSDPHLLAIPKSLTLDYLFDMIDSKLGNYNNPLRASIEGQALGLGYIPATESYRVFIRLSKSTDKGILESKGFKPVTVLEAILVRALSIIERPTQSGEWAKTLSKSFYKDIALFFTDEMDSEYYIGALRV